MSKAEAILVTEVKTKPKTWAEFIGAEKYALAIYRLQNEVGLTFKEARAMLTPSEFDIELTEEWGCSIENIYNLSRKGWAKLNKHTGGDGLKNLEFAPTYMWHIL